MFQIERVVGNSHLNADGRLALGSSIDFMQDCSIFHIHSLEALTRYFDASNIGIYLVFRQIDIVRIPVFGEQLKIKTWIYAVNNICGYRNTIISDEQNSPCINTYAIGVSVNLETERPVRLPEDIIKTIPLYEPFQMKYLPRKIVMPQEPRAIEKDIPIRKYHLDANRHVNNSKYVTIAEEYLPDGFEPARVRIEYKIPAKYRDIIKPYLYSTNENTFLVNLCNENRKSFVIVEFSKSVSGIEKGGRGAVFKAQKGLKDAVK
ncbi:MAG: Acyl-ACP thioesterase [Smithella sp. PtaU1.Bin162]|nr:MAG: Acyl-ACP thioesterase [Smithella sp. PtaU1.Bin162]